MQEQTSLIPDLIRRAGVDDREAKAVLEASFWDLRKAAANILAARRTERPCGAGTYPATNFR